MLAPGTGAVSAVAPQAEPQADPNALPHALAMDYGPQGLLGVPAPAIVVSATFLIFDAIGVVAAAASTADAMASAVGGVDPVVLITVAASLLTILFQKIGI